jgi:peptidoglycan/LPS O-acetylase OafA/YrhL
MHNKVQHIRELDGLRGLLALWVAISHILCWTGISDRWQLPDIFQDAWKIFIYAQSAVDIFIILSGFVISFLIAKFQDLYPKEIYKAFITNRFFRLYPVYLICLMIAIPASMLVPTILERSSWSNTSYFVPLRSIVASEQSNFIQHLLLHLSLLNGLIPKSLLSNATATFLPTAWSITLEWQYYLVAPAIAAMLMSPRGLITVLLIALCGKYAAPEWTNLHLAFLPSQLHLFLIGIASYHLFQSRSMRFNMTNHGITIGLIAIIGAAFLSNWHPITLGVWSVTIGTLLTQTLEDSKSLFFPVSQFLSLNLLQNLGKISYPLYLIHWPLICILLFILNLLFPGIHSDAAAMILLTIGLPLIITISFVLHKVIEKPGVQLGKRMISKLTTQ